MIKLLEFFFFRWFQLGKMDVQTIVFLDGFLVQPSLFLLHILKQAHGIMHLKQINTQGNHGVLYSTHVPYVCKCADYIALLIQNIYICDIQGLVTNIITSKMQ